MTLYTPLTYNILAILLGTVSAGLWFFSARVKFPGLTHDGGKAQTKAWAVASRRNGWGALFMVGSMVCMAMAEIVKGAALCA